MSKLDVEGLIGEVAANGSLGGAIAATIRAHIEGLEAQLSEARDTNRRLNRRVQEAEAAIPSYRKLVAEPPNGDGVRFVNGNMGRALLAHYCNQATERAEAAEARVRELEGLIRTLVSAITPLHNAHMPIERELISDEDVEAAQEALRRVMVLAPNLFYPSDTAIATTEQDHD